MIDSPTPKTWTDFETTARSHMSSSFGSTLSRYMAFISGGTPGRQKKQHLPWRREKPEAVPREFGRISLPSGMRAWMAFEAEGLRFLAAKNSLSRRRPSACSTSSTEQNSAKAWRVKSSGVGPMPPVMTATSARSAVLRSARMISARASSTATWRVTRKPRRVNRSERNAALVSAIRPAMSSLPIDRISAVMAPYSWPCSAS